MQSESAQIGRVPRMQRGFSERVGGRTTDGHERGAKGGGSLLQDSFLSRGDFCLLGLCALTVVRKV